MKKSWIWGLAVLGLSAMPVVAPAGEVKDAGAGTTKPAYTKVSGKVSAVNAGANTITFAKKDGTSQVVTVTADTKVKVNGQVGTLADITVDMYGGAKLSENGSPIAVHAWNKREKTKS